MSDMPINRRLRNSSRNPITSGKVIRQLFEASLRMIEIGRTKRSTAP